jgi:hypothetical protein
VRAVLDDGEGVYVVHDSDVVEALLGRAADAVRLDAPETWTSDKLLELLSASALRALLARARSGEGAFAPRRGKYARNSRNVTSGVDLDAVIEMVLLELVSAIEEHEENLVETFCKFDVDAGGLALDEFTRMVDWCVGPGVMSDTHLAEIFENVEAEADGDDDDDDTIADPRAFAASMVRSSCPLAYPVHCRDHWQVDADVAVGAGDQPPPPV